MAATATRTAQRTIHPVHAVLLASILPLFFGALLSDWAYSSTKVVQWINFAAWLVSGGLVLAGLTLAWAAIDYLRADRVRDRSSMVYVAVLLGTCILGLIDALLHAKDAWATMPAGLMLSILLTLVALAAVWLGFSTLRTGGAR